MAVALAIPASVESHAGEPDWHCQAFAGSVAGTLHTVLMETVVCGNCGQRFTIRHNTAFQGP
jgi:hypothetical protein